MRTGAEGTDEKPSSLATKEQRLRDILQDMAEAIVAFSGGVDSTLLLKVAAEELDDDVVAVTARSPAYIDEEYDTATELARDFGVEHITIQTEETNDPNFARNPTDRCYHCKRELFGRLQELARKRDIRWVADATNLDDCSDYRPGMQAAEELGVRSPLMEAELTKGDIRELSRSLELPTWDKPSMACLASRFPYGEKITESKLNRVEKAEEYLRELGFQQLRVRNHQDTARIEVSPEDIHRVFEGGNRPKIVARLEELGFSYVTLDLEGYRTGSMNEVLSEEERQ